MINKRIGIIGCGNMGEALLSRLSSILDKSTALMVSELDAAKRAKIQDKYRIIVGFNNNYLVKYSDVIILAVKPKDFDKLLKEICPDFSSKKLLISIAAGLTTKHIEAVVGKDVPVIRAMPNMAAIIGESISSITKGSSATREDMNLAKEIFSTIGEVVEVKEKLVDAVTAISGSGPAYFFYMIESLIEAAQKLGLERKVAEDIVLKTALGSLKLLHALKEQPAILRKKVTSKGGTTEAALKIFVARKFKNIISEATKRARNRSRELSRG